MNDYVRLCPVCGTIAAPEAAQCGQCGTLLLGVDLSLRQEAPAVLPAAAVEGLQCPYEDCGALNAPGSDACLYCGRPMQDESEPGAVPPAPTFAYRLPQALAAKFRIAEVLADASYAGDLRRQIGARAADWQTQSPWLAHLLASTEPAAWVMASFLLSYA